MTSTRIVAAIAIGSLGVLALYHARYRRLIPAALLQAAEQGFEIGYEHARTEAREPHPQPSAALNAEFVDGQRHNAGLQ